MNRNEFKLTSIFWLSFFFSGFGFLATSTMMAIQQRANPSRFFRSNREFVCLFMFWALAMAIKKISMSSKVVLVFFVCYKKKNNIFLVRMKQMRPIFANAFFNWKENMSVLRSVRFFLGICLSLSISFDLFTQSANEIFFFVSSRAIIFSYFLLFFYVSNNFSFSDKQFIL